MVCVSASAHAQRFLATISHPAAIPVARAPNASVATAGFKYVDITVWGFQPSSAGPVQIVVETVANASRVEIGRFGIYPELRFSATDATKAQRFGLAIPAGLRLDESTRLIVRILPSRGNGEGATVEVGAGQLR